MIICRPTGEDDLLLTSLAPFTHNLNEIGGNATAYICTGNTCAMPITDPHQMLDLLNRVNADSQIKKNT
jgi:uncharacterized protein YyaL (SSP411 family)